MLRLSATVTLAFVAHAFVAHPVGAQPATAQTAAAQPAAAQPPIARVNGAVFDSLARAPLPGAMVQLVASDTTNRYGQTVVSDALGRFVFDSVPDGSYLLGFYHPLLDSLGVEPMVRSVRVAAQRSLSADLAIPSAKRVRDAMCRASGAPTSGAVVVGVVHDARDRAPVRGVTVAARWVEYAFAEKNIARVTANASDTTRANGWFALCNVPSGGSIVLVANRGADSTDVIELDVPKDGFLRRELFLDDASRTRAAGGFRGTVVAGLGGKPIEGAIVSVSGGTSTRTDATGAWTLVDAPAGTRTFEVRAVGFYPVRGTVDVTSGGRTLVTKMSTMKAVLDTVKVRADRLADNTGFEERRRSGQGRFLTPSDVERRQPFMTSELFRQVPGVRMNGDAIAVRGAIADWCTPAVYINDMYMFSLTASEIDMWVHPNEIKGIEVYTGATAPPQYQPGMSGCGAIVMWTKRVENNRHVTRTAVLRAVGIVAIVLFIGSRFP